MEQKRFLEESASKYHSKIVCGWEGLYVRKRQYLYEKLRPHFTGGSVLELGCADGQMTQWLAQDFKEVTVVDGSETFLREVAGKISCPNVRFVASLFEEYDPQDCYEVIMATHILEHLDDPVQVLRRSKQWLSPGGKIMLAVPNARSLHRCVGVKMGLLSSTESLNEQDVILGHRRVYTPELLRKHVTDAGLRVDEFGGNMLKPLSNRQIEENWSDELIQAFFDLGEDWPELCAEIFVIASADEGSPDKRVES